ncbi:hypothetical protein Bca52824_067233 [Brassica carinata]|uniref:RRM domain-containing protein n=1 Tax=Brassica carinata TaxID=52824 RepID=A0A8X7QM86_BRACI|nr:hypothetical protein Bca52824_067233 [Brassica carinata]
MSQPNNNSNNNGDDKKYKKIFVGGLAWRVTADGLRSFFQERYGEVLEANVVSETLPGGNLKSKGYGFVTFRDAESANRACQPPYPEIEGRQTNINLAYLKAKNNPNHSNQTGLLQQAGPSHQYQHGPSNQMTWHQYHNGWFNQVDWQQYPPFYRNPNFPQVYWGSYYYYGAYRHMYDVQHYPCPSTVNLHQTNGVRPPGMSQPPRGPILKELPDTSPEAVSTADVVSKDNNEEVDTETYSGVDQPKVKDQEPEISEQDNDSKQKGNDQEGEINGQENGIKQDAEDQEGEINGQDNDIKQDVKDEEEKIVSGEDDDTKQGAGVTNQPCCGIKVTLPIETVCEEKSEEKTQDMEAGLITKKKEADKNA